jgi:hypothetical protein
MVPAYDGLVAERLVEFVLILKVLGTGGMGRYCQGQVRKNAGRHAMRFPPHSCEHCCHTGRTAAPGVNSPEEISSKKSAPRNELEISPH